jgi:hypothetical protein
LEKCCYFVKNIFRLEVYGKLSKKQIEEYKRLCYERDHGSFLTPDGLHFICEANNMEPEAIGKHILECLAHMRAFDDYRR